MSKKHFIALADAIREHNRVARNRKEFCELFTLDQLDTLAQFCAEQNPAFNRSRWLGYIAGENGPNGGAVKERD